MSRSTLVSTLLGEAAGAGDVPAFRRVRAVRIRTCRAHRYPLRSGHHHLGTYGPPRYQQWGTASETEISTAVSRFATTRGCPISALETITTRPGSLRIAPAGRALCNSAEYRLAARGGPLEPVPGRIGHGFVNEACVGGYQDRRVVPTARSSAGCAPAKYPRAGSDRISLLQRLDETQNHSHHQGILGCRVAL
jgi:hypothetical protein